jgi:hypothetical protein
MDGRGCRRAVTATLMAALLSSIVVVGTARAAPDEPPSLGPGCDPERPVIAHHDVGAGTEQVMSHPPAVPSGNRSSGGPNAAARGGRPILCTNYTGFPGGESRIEVGNDGTVFFSPAPYLRGVGSLGYGPDAHPTGEQWMFQNGGVAVSTDQGASWTLSLPLEASWTLDDALSLYDRDAGRYFWMPLNSNPFPQTGPSVRDQGPLIETRILATDDRGRTWQIGSPFGPLSDRAALAAARPAVGQPPSVNYPNVLYYCHVFGTDRGTCSKSLNGGKDWTLTGFSHGPGVHPECDGATETTGRPRWHSLAALPDGSVVTVITCEGNSFLARTRDQGSTWPFERKAGTSEALQLERAGDLRSDREGNLYLVRLTEAHELMLSVSVDEGQTWSREIEVTAPGVTRVHDNWYYAVGEPGHLAFTYNGGRDPEATTFDGYLTETRNALEALTGSPVRSWSAMVNDESVPLMYGDTLQGVGLAPISGQPVRLPPPQVHQLGSAIAPDGSPWSSFTEDCGPDPDAPRCQEQNNQSKGLAARLLWPR